MSVSVEPAESTVEMLADVLDRFSQADVVTLDDAALRDQVLGLLTVANRAYGELCRRMDVFDQRGLAEPDGFRSSKAWLQAFGRLSGTAARRVVKSARVLRGLPELTAAAGRGEFGEEHLRCAVALADRVGVEEMAGVEPVLVRAAGVLDPQRFGVVCERVRGHVAPDGADPGRDFASRTVSLCPVAGMVQVRGQLDPEGGAALATALDALMPPPGPDNQRNAGQRRADALVELARLPLSAGKLPTVGGQRPQVGVLVHPQALSPETLSRLAQAQQDASAARRLREFLDEGRSTDGAPDRASDRASGSASTESVLFGRAQSALRRHVIGEAATDSANARAPAPGLLPEPMSSGQGWADPPWLNWVGPVAPEVAQRIACDSDVFRIVMDPTNGMPLDVGRTHRLVPYWMRRALWARDRGCRWIGCTVPAEWSDAHHLTPWADGGETSVARCLLLCRFHHGLVHEGGWSIDLDPHTGRVSILRPGGLPYSQGPAVSGAWTGTASWTGMAARSDTDSLWRRPSAAGQQSVS